MSRRFQAAAIVTCLLSIHCSSALGQQTEQRKYGDCLAEFDIAKDGDLPILPVKLDGRQYSFVLDTGSDFTVYDRSLLPSRPWRSVPVETLSGRKVIDVFDAPNASIGKLSLRHRSLVPGTDLQMIRQLSGYDIRGIVGMDFLSKYVIQLDIAAGKVIFSDSATGDLGQRLPIRNQEDGRFVDVSVSGLEQPQRFLIDTGSTPFANMKKELVRDLAERGKAKSVGAALTVGLSGTDTITRWFLDSLKVGDCEHRNVTLVGSAQNVLGLGFWSTCVVTFDFPNGVLYLKNNEHWRRQDDVDLSGLHLVRVDGKVVVLSIDEDSPAAVSGLRPRDMILRLDGTGTDQLSMFSIRRRLCSRATRVKMAVARADKSMDVTLALGTLQADRAEKVERQ